MPSLLQPFTGKSLWVTVVSWCWTFASGLLLVVPPLVSSANEPVKSLEDEVLVMRFYLHVGRG